MGMFQKFWQFQKVVNLMSNRAMYERYWAAESVSESFAEVRLTLKYKSFLASIRWKSYCIPS
jgi:hypothetical protein